MGGRFLGTEVSVWPSLHMETHLAGPPAEGKTPCRLPLEVSDGSRPMWLQRMEAIMRYDTSSASCALSILLEQMALRFLCALMCCECYYGLLWGGSQPGAIRGGIWTLAWKKESRRISHFPWIVLMYRILSSWALCLRLSRALLARSMVLRSLSRNVCAQYFHSASRITCHHFVRQCWVIRSPWFTGLSLRAHCVA